MDSVDAVLVDFSRRSPVLIHSHSHPIPRDLHKDLCSCVEAPENTGIQVLGDLDTRLGRLFAEAALALLDSADKPAAEIMAIGSHGQTVLHQPDGANPFSMQLGNPACIVEMTGITTVAGFRSRDLAAGGQGAPLVPGFHAHMFSDGQEARVILNLGGIANITLLPGVKASVEGFDTGPGNLLLDQWCQRCCGQPYDTSGTWAATGQVHTELLESMLSDPFFQQRPPKSTGCERFNMAWLNAAIDKLSGTAPAAADIQATLTELTAQTAADAIRDFSVNTQRVLVCGGGVHNQDLIARLRKQLTGCPVESTNNHGLDPDWVEAVAFAWLAKQTLDGKPGNIPAVTGARHPVVLGAIYPR